MVAGDASSFSVEGRCENAEVVGGSGQRLEEEGIGV